MNKPFKIARFNEVNDDWIILESHSSYDDADERFDYWVNKYPHSFIDILDPS